MRLCHMALVVLSLTGFGCAVEQAGEADDSSDFSAAAGGFKETDLAVLDYADRNDFVLAPVTSGDGTPKTNPDGTVKTVLVHGNWIARAIVRAAKETDQAKLVSDVHLSEAMAMVIAISAHDPRHPLYSLSELSTAMDPFSWSAERLANLKVAVEPSQFSQAEKVAAVGKLLAYARGHGYRIDPPASKVKTSLSAPLICEEAALSYGAILGRSAVTNEKKRTVQTQIDFTVEPAGIYYRATAVKVKVPSDPSLAYFELYGAVDQVPMQIDGKGTRTFGDIVATVNNDGNGYSISTVHKTKSGKFYEDTQAYERMTTVTCSATVPF